jgi:hypothetical protein
MVRVYGDEGSVVARGQGIVTSAGEMATLNPNAE